jgi:hypothetical protein
LRLRLEFSILAFSLCFGKVVFADYQVDRLYAKENWVLDLTHDLTDGDFWCSANTFNNKNQIFSITAYSNRIITLIILDPRWDITDRSVRFQIDVDRSRWIIDGIGHESGITLTLNNAGNSAAFLNELANGNSVILFNSSSETLATFSLRGSSNTMRRLFACLDQITGGNQATSTSDPF